jgi:hypothetical protein
MQVQDIPVVLKGFLKPNIIWFIIRSLIFPKKNPVEPKDF